MRLPCETIRDLLPLYHDGVCSEVSRTLVAEHLNVCPDCQKMLDALDMEMAVLKPEVDEAKPLKELKTKWRRKTWKKGTAIGLAVFLMVFWGWFYLTQGSSVAIRAEEYTVEEVLQFSNGMYYVRYSFPYSFGGICADIHRTEDGQVHIREYRPILSRTEKEGKRKVRVQIIDPRDTIHADSGAEVPVSAFYVGCPEEGDGLLVWSADMEVRRATPEEERQYLYGQISNW